MDQVRVAAELFDSPSRAFPIRLWTGAELPPRRADGSGGRLVLRSPQALAALLPPAAERRLAEAYIAGDLEIEGDLIGLLEDAARWEGPRRSAVLAAAAVEGLVRRAVAGAEETLEARLGGRTHSPERDQAAVRHHYDLSDDFYQLFLDRGLNYSCALFERGDETLEEAQLAKLDLVCRKLGLGPGQRLLDVGCGWGALLEHAASRYGAGGLGITLSQHQLAAARLRLGAVEPGSAMAVEATDYRRLEPGAPFDKVASIGMMEHVGRARLDEYFAAAFRLTRPGGLFLNHAIADGRPGQTVPWVSHGGGFIFGYIFPDAEIVPVGEVVAAAERAGFEVRDLESLREHYEQTLVQWLARLEARFPEAEAIVGRARARAWRLYLAASALSFRVGTNTVFQLLLARRTGGGRVEGLPRTRSAWYPTR